MYKKSLWAATSILVISAFGYYDFNKRTITTEKLLERSEYIYSSSTEYDKEKKNDFKSSLTIILEHEGGFVNHPKDPGGMTNRGITKKVYERYLGREVREFEMRVLSPLDVTPIYKIRYWDRVNADSLPDGLDLCVFDFGVNAGPSRSVKMLQSMIGIKADGSIGEDTLVKLDEYIETHGIEYTIINFQATRQEYYQSLSHFDTFGKGWTNRNLQTLKLALNML